jgi:molybdate transport system regulatory protein
MVRLTIRVDFESGHALGPGKVGLLEQVAVTGSIRGAACAMQMSYRRAWLLLKAMETTFGAPLVRTATGGKWGGGAQLTPLGLKVVKNYRAIEKAARKAGARATATLAHSRHVPAQKPQDSRKKGRIHRL